MVWFSTGQVGLPMNVEIPKSPFLRSLDMSDGILVQNFRV